MAFRLSTTAKLFIDLPRQPARPLTDLFRVAIPSTVTTMMVPGEEIPHDRLNVTKRDARFSVEMGKRRLERFSSLHT